MEKETNPQEKIYQAKENKACFIGFCLGLVVMASFVIVDMQIRDMMTARTLHRAWSAQHMMMQKHQLKHPRVAQKHKPCKCAEQGKPCNCAKKGKECKCAKNKPCSCGANKRMNMRSQNKPQQPMSIQKPAKPAQIQNPAHIQTVPTWQRQAKFNPAEYAPYDKPGQVVIKGNICKNLPQGVECPKDVVVFINPKTSYSDEWWTKHWAGDQQITPADTRTVIYNLRTAADAQGNFEFHNLPAGKYYVGAEIRAPRPGKVCNTIRMGGQADVKRNITVTMTEVSPKEAAQIAPQK